MAGSFRELSETFSKAAQEFPRSGEAPDIMLTRYALLLKYKAETAEDKAEVVETLYSCGLSMLKEFTGPEPRVWRTGTAAENIKVVFDALRGPESLACIPERAPREMADVALDLLARAEGVTSSQISSDVRREAYKTTITSFARIALQTADAFQAAVDARDYDVKTGKNITPIKRIILKKDTTEGPQ